MKDKFFLLYELCVNTKLQAVSYEYNTYYL